MARGGFLGIRGRIHRRWMGAMITCLFLTSVIIYGWKKPTLSPHSYSWSTYYPVTTPLPPLLFARPDSTGHNHVTKRGREGEKGNQAGFVSEKLPVRHISSAGGDLTITTDPPSYRHDLHPPPPLHTHSHSVGVGEGGETARESTKSKGESTRGTGGTITATSMGEDDMNAKKSNIGEEIVGDMDEKNRSMKSKGVPKRNRVDMGSWDTWLEKWETEKGNRGSINKSGDDRNGMDKGNSDPRLVKWKIDEDNANVEKDSIHKSIGERNGVDKVNMDAMLDDRDTRLRNRARDEDNKGTGVDDSGTGVASVDDRGRGQAKANSNTGTGDGKSSGKHTSDDAGPIHTAPSVCDVSDIDVRLLRPRSLLKEVREEACSPHHHLVFVKVHKAASSTLANIMQRYGYTRQLNFALPNKKPKTRAYNYITKPGDKFTSASIRPPPPGGHYDLLWNHAIYNRSAFDTFMPRDTIYVTMLREPFQQFVSAFAFYNAHQISDIDPFQVNPFADYLHSYKHTKLLSYFRNKQSQDLGMGPEHVKNRTLRHQYLHQLSQDLQLVMITEMFDESLILLRRLMCWSIKDVLYISKNQNANKPTYVFGRQDYARHRQLAEADYDLYKFFKRKFLQTLEAQDVDFDHEVTHFKDVLRGVHLYCDQGQLLNQRYFFVPKSPWSPEFNVTPDDCELLVTAELTFLDKLLVASDAGKVKELSRPSNDAVDHLPQSDFHNRKFS